jgi:hypothetical protein
LSYIRGSRSINCTKPKLPASTFRAILSNKWINEALYRTADYVTTRQRNFEKTGLFRCLEVESINLSPSCIAVSSISTAPLCSKYSTQADNNYRKLRLPVYSVCPRSKITRSRTSSVSVGVLPMIGRSASQHGSVKCNNKICALWWCVNYEIRVYGPAGFFKLQKYRFSFVNKWFIATEKISNFGKAKWRL